MAWFGEIKHFERRNDAWFLGVDYYNDANPEIRVYRSGIFPLDTTKAQVLAWIKARGVEVMRISTLNEEWIVGTTIPIP